MAYTLHPEIIREAGRIFFPADAEYALEKLASTTLPMERSAPPPRVHLAVIWLSKGDRRRFDRELYGAVHDWRDTLVEAGLANADWTDVARARGVDASEW